MMKLLELLFDSVIGKAVAIGVGFIALLGWWSKRTAVDDDPPPLEWSGSKSSLASRHLQPGGRGGAGRHCY